MGVKHLWGIIQPAGKKEALESLRGKTLCVDLSTWICQAEETLPLKHAIAKPYLRNTIFRVLCLKRLGTRLIFLTEGKPPELKWNAILARAKAREEAEQQGKSSVAARNRKGKQRTRNGSSVDATNSKPKKIGRSTFQRKINECAQLLRYLGLPVIKSEGEAEACCALLDKKELADGCITQDGDTFLYGAKVVYRNLAISNKDPHVYHYSMEDIKNQLGIDREQMVALSLLFGCDYCDGVQGIGVKTALKLTNELSGNDILQRFRDWSKERKLHESASAIEKQIFKKLMQIDGFPNEEVVSEFLHPRDDILKIKEQIAWDYPDLVNIQRFCAKHMDWPEEYTLSKVLGVAANEHLSRISRGIPAKCPFSPSRLVKSRTLHGVPLCEVEWAINSKNEQSALWQGYPNVFITLESQQEILKTLPRLVEELEQMKLKKKVKGKKKRKKEDGKENEIEGLNQQIGLTEEDELLQREKTDDYIDLDDIAMKERNEKILQCCRVRFEEEGILEEDLNERDCSSNGVNGPERNSIENLIESFIQIDLSSFYCDSPLAEIMDGKIDENERNIDEKTRISTPGCETLEILPLRERLHRRALINSDKLDVEIKKQEENKRKMKLNAVALQKLKEGKKYDSEKFCLSEKGTQFSDENMQKIAKIGSKEKVKKEKVGNVMPMKTDAIKNVSLMTSNVYDMENDVKATKLIMVSPQRKIISNYSDCKEMSSRDSKIVEKANEFVSKCEGKDSDNAEAKSCCEQSVQEMEDFVGTSNKRRDESLDFENDAQCFVEMTGISNDSLGRILNESISLFDSPYLLKGQDFGGNDSSLDPEGYVNDLRKRFGISKHLTPVLCDSIAEDSPKSVTDDIRPKDVPLALMERLKKRWQQL